ncbi:efflux transporter outer membrane subunit [Methylibium sp.]|uniref:efflux transporter outer membrane subunit n=1 Tax=Methylibium sp. TaxID=2067992 RepID=UPI0025D6F6CD|nr:efflux transporter outer membrane subunit [Methylibium sp.]
MSSACAGSRSHWLWAAGALLSQLACTTVGPDFEAPEAALQPAWSSSSAATAAPITSDDSDAFWASFKDPVLLSLLRRAEAQSLTLQSAAKQVEQAQAIVRTTQATARPNVQLNVDSSYAQPDFASRLRGTNDGTTTDQALGQVSWEIDFWGKQRRALEADLATLQGTRAAQAAARLSLKASVASAYCNVRLYERRLAVAQANLLQQAENMRVAEARYRLGASSELDWRQAQTQYAQTQAQVPVLRSSLAEFQRSVSVLLGETPDTFARTQPSAAALPAVPLAVARGAPVDLLRRRPDVQQAEMTAAAQSARIGQAQAALYPSFSLSGSFGYSTTAGLGELFRWDSRALSAGAGLVLPIFDRGRLTSQVLVQDSLFAQAVLAYQNQVLQAQQEVEDALGSVAAYSAQTQDLQAADAAATRSAELAMTRYRAGQTDYTTVSSAEQARLQTSDSLVQAQGALLQAHISTWRALGGGGTMSPAVSHALQTEPLAGP